MLSLYEEIRKLWAASGGAGIYVVLPFGSFGEQLAHVRGVSTPDVRRLIVCKWRKRSRRFTKPMSIPMDEVRRLATGKEIIDAGLSQVGGR